MLTENSLKGLKTKDKRYFKSAGKNLLVCVNPNGIKSFFVYYKDIYTKKRKREKIGEYPKISLATARQEAKNFIDDLNAPKVDFMPAWESFFNTQIKNTSTFYQIAVNRYFEKNYKPIFEFLQLNQIGRIEILNALKPHLQKNHYESAKRCLGILKRFFKYCTTYGYIKNNPADSIELQNIIKKPSISHFATLTEPGKIKNLLANICECDSSVIVKVCAITGILTALRSLNTRELKWRDIDLKSGVVVIEASKMKNKKEFMLTLPKQLIEILKKLKQMKFESKYLFFSARGNTRILSENAVRAMLRNLGYSNDDITTHGFRAMFSTIANENNKDAEIIELCLAHTDKNQIRATYNHAKKEAQKAELWQWWADYLQNLYDYTKILI